MPILGLPLPSRRNYIRLCLRDYRRSQGGGADFMDMLIGLIVVGVIAAVIYSMISMGRSRQTMREILDRAPEIPGFVSNKSITVDTGDNDPDLFGIARISFNADRSLMRITRVRMVAPAMTHDAVYTGRDIISVEITQGNNTVSRTERSGGLVRAAVGGAAFGGAGAIVGAVTAGSVTVSQTEVQSLAVHVLLDDPNNPLQKFELLMAPAKTDDPHFEKAKNSAEQIHAQLQLMIRRAEAVAA